MIHIGGQDEKAPRWLLHLQQLGTGPAVLPCFDHREHKKSGLP